MKFIVDEMIYRKTCYCRQLTCSDKDVKNYCL